MFQDVNCVQYRAKLPAMKNRHNLLIIAAILV